MSRHLAVLAGAIALLQLGCPQKPQEGPGPGKEAGASGATPDKGGSAPKVAKADEGRFGKGDPIETVSVETEMSQDVVVDTAGRSQAEIAMAKAMSELSKFLMTVTITEDRTRMLINGKNMPMPLGSYLIHDAPGKRYAFIEAGKNEYRLLNGSEITSLFEGGPSTGRTNYTVTVTDTPEKETVAGYETVRSDVEVGFDWSVKFENKTKSGKTKAKLQVYHSADPRLKAAWAREMIDFLTLPFQDDEGRKVADTLKARLKFPLRWKMEVVVDGLESEAKPPVISTMVKAVKLEKIPANRFQIPPAGMKPAEGPWNPGKGAPTLGEEEVGKLREKPEARKPGDNSEAAPEQ